MPSLSPDPSFVDQVLAALPELAGKPWSPLHGGRTNQLWRVAESVVKAYDPAAASPLFPNDPSAEARALALLGPRGLSPRLIGAGEAWVAYAHVAGSPWRVDSAPVALALHDLHHQAAKGFRVLPSGAAALRAQAEAIASGCGTPLPPAPTVSGLGPVPRPGLIHGDAVPGNIIASAGNITLIDWQCPAEGDPCEDIATFLSPAMQWLYRGSVLSPAEAAAFLSAYPDRAMIDRYRSLAPLFRWRMMAHCQWKAERGAADYAVALRMEIAG